jgi:TIR domain
MAYLPSYDHDIFVSYAHQGQLGPWTLRLQQELAEALNLILFLKPPGKVVDVWVDEELRYNLELTPQLQERVTGSALLVVIMSPFYLSSTWCGKEVTWFAEVTRSRIAPRARVFVIHAQPTERSAWPPPLADLEPYPFFARHAKAGIELPLGLIGDDPDRASYKAQVYLLAGQIKQQIDDLLNEEEQRRQEQERRKRAEEEAREQATEPPPPSVVVFPPSPPKPPVLPPRVVFLETVGTPAAVDERAIIDEVRRALEALNVEVATPPTPTAVLPDPIGVERLFQNLLNAKASADGLILLRLDAAATADAWQLEYLSEIRLRSLKIRGGPPGRLVIEAASAGGQPLGSHVPLLGWGEPDAAGRLRAWVEGLPLAAKPAAERAA